MESCGHQWRFLYLNFVQGIQKTAHINVKWYSGMLTGHSFYSESKENINVIFQNQ